MISAAGAIPPLNHLYNAICDNRTHFLYSKGKADGKVPVLVYVAVRTIVFLLQKIRSFEQKKTQNVALYS